MAGVFALMLGFHLVYVTWLNPTYEYMGYKYPEKIGSLTVFSYILGLLPAFLMPIRLQRPSAFLNWIIYITVYLPCLLVLSFVGLRPDGEVRQVDLMLLVGMTLLSLGSKLPRLGLPRATVSDKVFWILVGGAGLGLMARVISVYWGHFEFVSWTRAYDIRFSGGELASAAGLAYPINWLSFVFLPLLMAIALLRKIPVLFLTAVGCAVLLYMTQGMKHILFSGLFIPLMFLLLRRRTDDFGLRIVWGIAFFFFAFFLYVAVFDAAQSSLAVLLGANVLQRIFGTPGLLMGTYQNFFADHPLTYYSHVTGIDHLVAYPYQNALGIEVGIATTGESFYNMNAGFWATDGLAALGPPGILVISAVMAIVFYGLDCICARHRTTAIALMLSQYILILANVSFFTSLVTGGLLLFIVIFYLMPEGVYGGSSQLSPVQTPSGGGARGPVPTAADFVALADKS